MIKVNRARVMIGLLAAFLMLAFALAWPSVTSAQSPVLNDDVRDVAKQLNCPTCAGRNLADCPTDTCTQWKLEIAEQLKQGKNSEQILDYFQDRFGTTVLQEPPKAGRTLALWVVPATMFVALAVIAAVVIKRATRSAQPVAGSPPVGPSPTAGAAEDPYAAELENQV